MPTSSWTSATTRSCVRAPGTGRALLGIDSAIEVAAARLAAAIGVAPEVIAHDQETGALVSRFLPAPADPCCRDDGTTPCSAG